MTWSRFSLALAGVGLLVCAILCGQRQTERAAAGQSEPLAAPVPPAETLVVVAGNGTAGYSGDGGPAIAAMLNAPQGVAVGKDGETYIADTDNNRVRRIDPQGVITTVAGTGESGYSGDGGDATEARLDRPSDVAIDGEGNVYIADSYNHRVRKIDQRGRISTVVGSGPVGVQNGGYSGDGRPATGARLWNPRGLAFGRDGSLYIADMANARVRKVDRAGIITTVAGSGTAGYTGDGGPAVKAKLAFPLDVAVGPSGSIYIADSENRRIRKVDPQGVITTIAGSGPEDGGSIAGTYSGDGGPATQAKMGYPQGVAVSGDGNLYIADADNRRIRKVDRDGIITTFLGPEPAESAEQDDGASGRGGVSYPVGLAITADGRICMTDSGNHRLYAVPTVEPQ